MKKLKIVLLCFSPLLGYTQSASDTPESNYREGLACLRGVTQKYDPDKAKLLFTKAATANYALAMNALGNIFVQGISSKVNIDSAIYWYSKAAENGNAKSYYNIGKIFQAGTLVKQDFDKAASYYSLGVKSNDIDCKSALGYMYFKGLGISQDYRAAFQLFTEASVTRDENAMYFLGLCYRNGYGTPVNTDQSKYWLKKAAGYHNNAAKHELNNEPLPENMSTIDFSLQRKIQLLRDYQEKFLPTNNNNYEGDYTGYAVYYDWSGEFVSEILPLTLSLKKENSFYEGQWVEGNSNAAQVRLNLTNGNLVFDNNSQYTRTNHYSNRNAEKWQFNSANLKWFFLNDSIQLSGFVQFYSPQRKEPGKPVQIFLTKSINNLSLGRFEISDFKLFPNPAQNHVNLMFSLGKTSKVSVQVTSQTGSILHTENSKLLPSGTYSYILQLNHLPSASYVVTIFVNGQAAVSKAIIKQ